MPHLSVDTEHRCEAELNKVTGSLSISQSECINAKTLHYPEGSRNPAIAHNPMNVCVASVYRN
jgi:hypothetical protein